MTRSDWRPEGRAWMHPACVFFVVKSEVPEIAAGGKTGVTEYLVMRGGGDDSAGFALATFSTLEEAIADAERRDAHTRDNGPKETP